VTPFLPVVCWRAAHSFFSPFIETSASLRGFVFLFLRAHVNGSPCERGRRRRVEWRALNVRPQSTKTKRHKRQTAVLVGSPRVHAALPVSRGCRSPERRRGKLRNSTGAHRAPSLPRSTILAVNSGASNGVSKISRSASRWDGANSVSAIPPACLPACVRMSSPECALPSKRSLSRLCCCAHRLGLFGS
jgi:hypothetical protein